MRRSNCDSSPPRFCSESLGRLVGPSARASVVFTHLIRRGGVPSGAAAVLVRGGVGATAPTISPPHNPDLPARPEDFRKSPHHEPEIPENIRINCTRLSEKTGSRPGNFQKRSTHPPPPKKSVTPLPHFPLRKKNRSVRSISKPGGLFYFSATICVSTGFSDETGWSVRSFPESIGPANFKIDRGDHLRTRIRGSPLPPASRSAKKTIGPTDLRIDRPDHPCPQKLAVPPGSFPKKTSTYPHEVFQKNDRGHELRGFREITGSSAKDSEKNKMRDRYPKRIKITGKPLRQSRSSTNRSCRPVRTGRRVLS